MRNNKQLRGSFDPKDSFTTAHQFVQARSNKRTTPDWAMNNTRVREILLRSFPHLKKDVRQRNAAARWMWVIQLYYRLGYTYVQVAEEIGSSPVKVKNIIRSIKRVARGQSANGSGLLGRKRGRPRKSCSKTVMVVEH